MLARCIFKGGNVNPKEQKPKNVKSPIPSKPVSTAKQERPSTPSVPRTQPLTRLEGKLNRRTDALFKALSTDYLLREQFVTDPAQILSEYLFRDRLSDETADAANQLIFAVMSNPRLRNWISEYSRFLRGSTPSRHVFALQFARAVATRGDEITALALIRGASEGQEHFVVQADLLRALISAIGRRVGSSGTEMSPGGTEMSPGGTEMSPGGTEMSPGGTEMSPGGTEMSPGTGTEMSPGIFFSGTEMSPGGTEMSPGTGTEMSPGAFFSGTEMSPGGTQISPGTGTDMSPGAFFSGTEMSPGGTQISPGTGTDMSPGAFFSGTEMSPGGTQISPGTGTDMSPGAFFSGTEMSPGGTQISPGTGTDMSPGAFGGGWASHFQITMNELVRYATELRARGALVSSGLEGR